MMYDYSNNMQISSSNLLYLVQQNNYPYDVNINARSNILDGY